ncbi:MAG: immunoglobulin-like domain-containing protein [Breznakia sp.]
MKRQMKVLICGVLAIMLMFPSTMVSAKEVEKISAENEQEQEASQIQTKVVGKTIEEVFGKNSNLTKSIVGSFNKPDTISKDTILTQELIEELDDFVGFDRHGTTSQNDDEAIEISYEDLEKLAIFPNIETILVYLYTGESIPPVIMNLSKLWSLTLSYESSRPNATIEGKGNLKEIPSDIVNLEKLEKIYATGQQIESLPESLASLKINFLDMSRNKITDVPESVFKAHSWKREFKIDEQRNEITLDNTFYPDENAKIVEVPVLYQNYLFKGSGNGFYYELQNPDGSKVKVDSVVTENKKSIEIPGAYLSHSGEYTLVATTKSGHALYNGINNNRPKQSEYTIHFKVEGDIHPSLAVEAFSEINVGDDFDELSGVVASDNEDTTLGVDDVVVSGERVDVNTAGLYKVEYSVSDSASQTTTASRMVLVNDGNYYAGNHLVMHAKGFTKLRNEVDTSEEAIKKAAGLKVYRKTNKEEVDADIWIQYGYSRYTAKLGFYKITLNVVGQDSGVERTIDAIVKDKDSVVEGEALVDAQDFKTNVYALSIQKDINRFIVDKAKVVAKKMDLNADVTPRITTNLTSTSIAGEYSAAISVEVGNDIATKEIKITVEGDEKPFLEVPEFTEIKVGDGFDALDGVKVSDKEDSALSVDDVVVSGKSVDTATAGFYKVEYSVTDSFSQTTTATRTVLVNDGNYEVGNSLILFAKDFTINIEDVDESKTGIKKSADVTVYDKTGKEVPGAAISVACGREYYKDKLGSYEIYFQLTEDQSYAEREIQAIVRSENSVIEKNAFVDAQNFTANVQALMTQVDINRFIEEEALVVAKDLRTNADVKASITTNLTSTSIAGEYSAAISVEVGNDIATKEIKITVEENENPVLEVPSFTEIKVGDGFDALDGVKVSDKEDSALSVDDVVVTGESVDVNTAGIYKVEYSVSDSFSQTTTAVQIVLVNDETYIQDNNYIIHAEDFEIDINDTNMDDAKMITLANVKVYDIVSGEWVSDPLIDIDRGGLQAKVGVYNVTFTYNPSITVTLIVHENTTTNPNNPDNSIEELPSTGDTSNITYYVFWMVVACFILGGVYDKHKRRKETKK